MKKFIVLISGACGTGKSTLLNTLMTGKYRNENTAGIEVDQVYRFVDQTFSGPNVQHLWRVARQNTGALANSMLKNGITNVFIVGNTIFKKEQISEILSNVEFDKEIRVLHFTLVQAKSTIIERIKMRQHSVPDWLDMHLADHNVHRDIEGTIRIDNSNISPQETLEMILEKINIYN